MKIKDSIREFLIKDDLSNALEFLNKLRIEKFDNEIIHYFAAFNEIKSAERMGILKYEDISTKKAVLRNGILELASEIEIYRRTKSNVVIDSFEILKGYQINSETLFGTKSNPKLGYKDDFYLQRSYLDKELRTSILFNQNIILKGKAGSGKSRALLELIKRYLTKYSIVLPKIDALDFTGFEKITNTDKIVVIYDDINLFFEQNFDSHFNSISKIVDCNKLSIIATCRSSEYDHIKEKLGETIAFFKEVEIQPLNHEDINEVSEAIKYSDKEMQLVDENIGSFFEK